MIRDERLLDATVLDHHVEDAVRERAVAAGPHRQKEVGRPRDGRDARVDDDDLRGVVAGAPNVVGQNRKTFGDVRARQEEGTGQRDVAPRIGRAVHTERHAVRRAGTDHAQAAVVVDVGGL